MSQIMISATALRNAVSLLVAALTATGSTNALAQGIFMDDFNLPTRQKGEINDSLDRQTGELAPVAYGSNTRNSGPGGSGYAYIEENQALELNPDEGGTAIVWTEAPLKTKAGFQLKVNVWPTVTQDSSTGSASVIVGSGAGTRTLSEAEQENGNSEGGIGIRISGSGLLEIRDFSKSGKAQLIEKPLEIGPKNTFRNVQFQISQSANGMPSVSIYVDKQAVLENYVRSQNFKDNYISFLATKGPGDNQSVFDDLSLEELP